MELGYTITPDFREANMRTQLFILSVAAALAVSTPIAAQSTKSAGGREGRTVKVTGCVERASDVLGEQGESGYVLAHTRGARVGKQLSPQSGLVVRLDPSGAQVDLANELGYRVSVTGRLSTEGASPRGAGPIGTAGSDTPRATGTAGKADSLPTIIVTSVTRTEGHCPAGW
jgi:hypothetical protein